MSRSIVFGGSGFLGSHVADALTKVGQEVTVFDIARSSYLTDGQRMIVGDILDEEAVAEAVQGHDYVYNFAGIADLDDAKERPGDTVLLNVLGNVNVMEAARVAGAKRFVYASTIYVYSQKGGFYRCSKQASEAYVEEFGRHRSLDYTILRFGTLYGPRATDTNAIYRYLAQGVKEGRITCEGTGEEIREYVHVRDAAELAVAILDEEYRNRHIIITGHNPTKLRDMINIIQEILGESVDVSFAEEQSRAHYRYTPYSYTPSIGHKLVSNCYVDMGQGLLECLEDMFGESEHTDADREHGR